MNFTWLLFLTSASLAVAQNASPSPTVTDPASAPTTSNALNWSFLGNALYVPSTTQMFKQSTNEQSHSLTMNRTMPFPIPTATGANLSNLDNISAPPRSLIPQVFAAVPASVLLDLLDPSKRRELASEFKAGSTPAWYQSLPPDVKNYMGTVRSQISEGALTSTTEPTNTEASATEGGTSSTATETGGSNENAAARGKGNVQAGMVEMLAVVGVGAVMML